MQVLLHQALERKNQRLPAVVLVLQRRLRQRLLHQPPGPEIVLPALQQILIPSSLVWSQSRVFVGLNTHFALLCCSPVPPKNEETRFTNSFIRTHQILISPANEMKLNELYGGL
jgi:hypothetical protein